MKRTILFLLQSFTVAMKHSAIVPYLSLLLSYTLLKIAAYAFRTYIG